MTEKELKIYKKGQIDMARKLYQVASKELKKLEKPKINKRKEFKVENGTYKEITDIYQELKGIKLEGAEFGEVKRAIKTMLYSNRTQKEIIDFMKFCYKVCEEIKNNNKEVINRFSWLENWTILTIKRKLPEFLAGKFQRKENSNSPYSSYEEVMGTKK